MSYLVCHQSIKCHQMTYYNDIQWHSNCLNSNMLTTSDDIRWHRSRSWRIPDHKECKSIPKVANMVHSGIPIWSTLDYFGTGTSGWEKTNGIPLGFHWDSTGADAGLRQGHIHGRSFLDQFLDSHIPRLPWTRTAWRNSVKYVHMGCDYGRWYNANRHHHSQCDDMR